MKIPSLAVASASGALLLAHAASALDCPPAGTSVPVVLNDWGDILLGIASEADAVCTLVVVTTDEEGGETFKPVGRSYGGHGWEGVSPTNQAFACEGPTCFATLPGPAARQEYRLATYTHAVTAEEEASRFLLQATFGPTNATIQDYLALPGGPAAFVRQQMDLPGTSHRAFFRQNTQARTHTDYSVGRRRGPCEAGSRWRKFALSPEDKNQGLSVDDATAPPYLIRVNGQARTQMMDLPSALSPGVSGQINSWPVPRTGGRWTFSGSGHIDNPAVQFFEDPTDLFANVANGTSVPILLNLTGPTEFRRTQDGNYGEWMVHNEAIVDDACTLMANGKTDVLGQDAFGEWWLYDPILMLRENTPTSMLEDGGASSSPSSLCTNAPMSYANEAYCTYTNETVCGSSRGFVCPGDETEVANEPDSIISFDYVRDGALDNTHGPVADFEHQKWTTWVHLALNADDQLRQRAAWAFAQILVSDGRFLDTNTEPNVHFYDIFVKNAFGNYFDMLKGIAFSPLMADSLTYLESKSTAVTGNFPDENFSREIMQLFTIGHWKLNPDGTNQLDEQGNPFETYDSEMIMDMARAWTGFRDRPMRGNIEGHQYWGNWLDSLELVPSYRDHFPKKSINGGFIGDGLPLCDELPEQPHLRKGATWRLLGRSESPFMTTPEKVWNGAGELWIDLPTTDPLYDVICGAGVECAYPMSVTLETNLPKTSSTVSTLDSIRVVKLNDVFYEYVELPCVDLPFYSGGRAVKWDPNGSGSRCAAPDSKQGSGCCKPGDTRAFPNMCAFPNERLTYEAHLESCASNPEAAQGSCTDLTRIATNKCGDNDCCTVHRWMWTSSPCDTDLKVTEEGRVAIVHTPQTSGLVDSIYNDTTKNYFGVDFSHENFPRPSNGCGYGMCTLQSDNTCRCTTSTLTEAVFSNEYFASPQPGDLSSISQSLNIGSADPAAYDGGTYTQTTTWSDSQHTVQVWQHTSGAAEDSIVGVTENGSTKFFKNKVSMVRIVDPVAPPTASPPPTTTNVTASPTSSPSASPTTATPAPVTEFRNPPKFRHGLKDAIMETDLVLDSYFRHPNTAPFVSYRLIQRFGVSNPSPGYVERVASAFKTGTYSSEGTNFGTGSYGDLASTIAAVLLDREARTAALEADPTYGSLREPLLKVMHLFRSLEYTTGSEYVYFESLDSKIGEMPYAFPSVFSFFLPDHTPTGPVQSAGLVAPEAFQFDIPQIVGFMKGVLSLAKYGFSSCHGGFGSGGSCVVEGAFSSASGYLAFTPSSQEALVDELDLLLTGGRLSSDAKAIIGKALADSQVTTDEQRLRLAQQLILACPEFHASGLVKLNSDKNREQGTSEQNPTKPYKAIVYLFMGGGADTYNLLVPHSNCTEKDMYAEYASVRGNIALSKDELLPIDAGSDQPCATFGIHPGFTYLHQLYEEGDASFFANAGVLRKASDRSNYRHNHAGLSLFSHANQVNAMKVNPDGDAYDTGVLGRMMDVLVPNGYLTASTSTGKGGASGGTVVMNHDPKKGPPVTYLSGTFGPTPFDPVPTVTHMPSLIEALNNATSLSSSIFGETWSNNLLQSLDVNEFLFEMLHTVSIETNFPATSIGDQLRLMSKLMKTRSSRKVERDAFAVSYGSFDSHRDLKDSHATLYGHMDDALESFTQEMKAQGLWNDVVLVALSEFGRTLTENGGGGTDHAWGGNYFAIGGAIRGGKIHGSYPDSLTPGSQLIIDRGRVVPTMGFDTIFNGIASWFGVEEENLVDVLPNRGNMHLLLTKEDMFKDVTPSPTAAPTELVTEPPTAAPFDRSRYEYFETQVTFDNLRSKTNNVLEVNGIKTGDSRLTATSGIEGTDHVVSITRTGLDLDGGGVGNDSLSWKVRVRGMRNVQTYWCYPGRCSAVSGGNDGAQIAVDSYGWGVIDTRIGRNGESIIFSIEDIDLTTDERGSFTAEFNGFRGVWLTAGKYIFGYGTNLQSVSNGTINHAVSPPLEELQVTVGVLATERIRDVDGTFTVSGYRDMCVPDGAACTSTGDCCSSACHETGYCGDDIFMNSMTWTETFNLALGQPTSQSSTFSVGVASRAVDGTTNGKWTDGSVTHTEGTDPTPWWRVRFSQPGTVGSEIDEVVVFNRSDNCCIFRMDGLEVYILDANGNEVTMQSIGTAGLVNTLTFGGVEGAMIEIRKDPAKEDTVISLAEVVVNGRQRLTPA